MSKLTEEQITLAAFGAVVGNEMKAMGEGVSQAPKVGDKPMSYQSIRPQDLIKQARSHEEGIPNQDEVRPDNSESPLEVPQQVVNPQQPQVRRTMEPQQAATNPTSIEEYESYRVFQEQLCVSLNSVETLLKKILKKLD